jgi:hypothetical protein
MTPAVLLDVAKVRPLWTGQPQVVAQTPQFASRLLDPGGSDRAPLLIANGLSATVCRVAMPATAEGTIAAPRGRLCVPGRIWDDPRWARPLPWRTWLQGFFGPEGFVAAGALALVNVVLPVGFLWLIAGRRRVFRTWVLMLVPLAAAVPLMFYQMVTPWLPVGSYRLVSSESRVFLAGTLAGLPVVYYVGWLGASVLRGRSKAVVALLGLSVVFALAIAGIWAWRDMKSMAPLEHYGREGWYLAALPGAYAAAVLWGIGQVVVGIYVWVRRLRGGG